jgi:hypothetical protein
MYKLNNKTALQELCKEKDFEINIILDLGYEIHLAQTNINVNAPKGEAMKIMKRQFTKERTDEFNYALQKESWQNSLSNLHAHTSFNAFIGSILYHYLQV